MPLNSLDTYRFVAPQAQNTRLKLDEQLGLSSNGQRNIGNLFTRAWDCITRSSSQIETNKAITRDFILALREEYGDEIAQTMAYSLSAQLSSGRPLTGYRIERVLEKAQQMCDNLQANNRALLDDCLPALTDLFMNDRQDGNIHPDVLNRTQAMSLLRQAIEGSEPFKQHSFHNALHHLMDMFGEDGDQLARDGFIGHFKTFARETLQHEVSARLLPDITRVSDRHDGNIHDGYLLSHLCGGLPESEHYRLHQIDAYVNQLAAESLRLNRDIHASHIGSLLGTYEYLEDGFQYLSQVDNSQMDDVGKAYLDALLNDIAHLQTLFNERLGLQGFTPDQMRALLEVNRETGQIEQDMTDGDPKKTAPRYPEMQQQINDNLTILRGIQPDNDMGRLVLQTLIQRGEHALPLIRDLQVATLNGLHGDDLRSSKGTPEEILARLGEHGFDGPDLAWMHTQGLNVGDTVMRFSPAQIQLLKSQGLGIDLGLQYLDKGIPIHARTLVQYVDDLIVGEPRAMSGGTISKPYEVTYGSDRTVYKEPQINPLDGRESGYGPSSELLGIDPLRPQMTVRNIATKVVDEQLGFGLVPKTGIGVLNGRLGLVMDFAEGLTPRYDIQRDVTEGRWPLMRAMLGDGLLQAIQEGNKAIIDELMSFLQINQQRYELGEFDVSDDSVGQTILRLSAGTPQEQDDARRMLQDLPGQIKDGRVIQELRIIEAVQRGNDSVDFNAPEVRRGLVQLQLLDALTAQGDRHQANYVITRDPDGRCTGVIAIDNDQAFGTKIRNPNDLLRSVFEGSVMGPDGIQRKGTDGLNGVLLPGVVDRSMKEAFDKLSPDTLRQSLAGLLPEQEIETTLQRLTIIKQHLETLEQKGMVIDDDQWGGVKAEQALQDRNTSYVARDRMYIAQLLQEEQDEAMDQQHPL